MQCPCTVHQAEAWVQEIVLHKAQVIPLGRQRGLGAVVARNSSHPAVRPGRAIADADPQPTPHQTNQVKQTHLTLARASLRQCAWAWEVVASACRQGRGRQGRCVSTHWPGGTHTGSLGVQHEQQQWAEDSWAAAPFNSKVPQECATLASKVVLVGVCYLGVQAGCNAAWGEARQEQLQA